MYSYQTAMSALEKPIQNAAAQVLFTEYAYLNKT